MTGKLFALGEWTKSELVMTNCINFTQFKSLCNILKGDFFQPKRTKYLLYARQKFCNLIFKFMVNRTLTNEVNMKRKFLVAIVTGSHHTNLISEFD